MSNRNNVCRVLALTAAIVITAAIELSALPLLAPRAGLKRTSSCPARATTRCCRPAMRVGARHDPVALRHQGRPVLELRPALREFDQIREIAFRPWAEGTIPRRFCSGRVLVSDGRWRTVHYSIIEDGGMIGANWGVEWCVVGLDRNWAYNPRCKMARP